MNIVLGAATNNCRRLGREKIRASGQVCVLLTLVALQAITVSSAFAQGKAGGADWLSVITTFLLDEPEVIEVPETCTQKSDAGVDIIDLDHLVGVSALPYICSGEDVDSCVAKLIKKALPLGCRSHIDIFVPGTAQEDGNPKQFRSLVDTGDNRGALSMGYSAGNETDLTNYDRGVRKSRDVLAILLRVIKEEFAPDSVRIYGHSKGSHGVALEADRTLGVAGFENYHFFAFGQAARTSVKIDDTADMVPARMGDAGYIERLSDNLVGITWQNDEVRDYWGVGFNGLKPPLSIRYPGHVYGATTIGTGIPLYTRFDHHNTYGGGYAEKSVPYCYTGSGFVLAGFVNNRCIKKVDTEFKAYFWGNTDCRARAFAMLEDSSSDGRIWIGTSGPRVSDTNCAPKEGTVRATYKFGYRYNRADKDCHLNIKVSALGLNSPGPDDSRPGGTSFSLKVKEDTALIGRAKEKTGSINLPYNMNLRLEAYLTREPGIGNCGAPAETESYVDYLEVKFTHPVTGKQNFERFLIGNSEAAAYPLQRAHNKAKSPWTRTSGQWELQYDPVYTALKIEGNTYAESETKRSLVSTIRIEKRIHLID